MENQNKELLNELKENIIEQIENLLTLSYSIGEREGMSQVLDKMREKLNG